MPPSRSIMMPRLNVITSDTSAPIHADGM